MGTLEEETNSKTGRGFRSSEMRMQGPGSDLVSAWSPFPGVREDMETSWAQKSEILRKNSGDLF